MSEEPTYVGEDQEYAPFWQPEPGNEIKGRLESVHVMEGKYGATPVVTLKKSDGERIAILVKGTVFREEMAQRRPQPGDELEIKYFGTKAPKDGGIPYHVYKVLSGGTEPEFNWNAFVNPERRPTADAYGAPVSSARATAEPPIPPADYSSVASAADGSGAGGRELW